METRLSSTGVVAGLTVLGLLVSVTGCEKVEVGDTAAAAAVPPPVVTSESGIEMVRLPAAEFTMGSNSGDADEAPVHEVSLDSFLIDRYEVTQEEYAKRVIGNPSKFKDPKHPIERVRWSEAAIYCNARSLAEGLEPCYDEQTYECNFEASGYRLPTEAEWEYACRAGSDGDYSFTGGQRKLGDYAWFRDNAAETTHPVGMKKPNAWGLYDMHGNVAEWCQDLYDEAFYQTSPEENPCGLTGESIRVVRGGSWNSTAESCRSAYRSGEAPGSELDTCFARPDIGFRCVRRPDADAAPEKVAASEPSELN